MLTSHLFTFFLSLSLQGASTGPPLVRDGGAYSRYVANYFFTVGAQ
jgi:hypothetical protein